MNREPWFASSSGTGDLALTIKGLLLSLVPLGLIASKYYGFDVLESDLTAWIEGITGGLSAAVIAVGVIRKIANRYF